MPICSRRKIEPPLLVGNCKRYEEQVGPYARFVLKMSMYGSYHRAKDLACFINAGVAKSLEPIEYLELLVQQGDVGFKIIMVLLPMIHCLG
jgi:hypothetical protein